MPFKVEYMPGPGDDPFVRLFGRIFEAGKPVDIDEEADPRVAQKLRNHPRFRDPSKREDKKAAKQAEKDARAADELVDGRTKAAREAKQKALEAAGEAAAAERARAHAEGLREAKAAARAEFGGADAVGGPLNPPGPPVDGGDETKILGEHVD